MQLDNYTYDFILFFFLIVTAICCILFFCDALFLYHQWTPPVDTVEAVRSCGRLCANPRLQITFLYVLLDTDI